MAIVVGRRATRRRRAGLRGMDGCACKSLALRSPGMAGMGDAGGEAQIRALLASLPKCFDGATAVGILNQAAAVPPPAGADRGTTGFVRQHVADAVNSPASIGLEIPFWPWSTAPVYCAGSPQHNAVKALLASMLPAAINATKARLEEAHPSLRAIANAEAAVGNALSFGLGGIWNTLGKTAKYALIGGGVLVGVYTLGKVATIAKAVRG